MKHAGVKTKKVPKLRFRGFSDRWKESTLGKHSKSISSGKSATTNIVGGAYSVYGSTGRIGTTHLADYSGDKILIARVGANAGTIYRVSGQYAISDNTLIVELENDLNINFAFNLLRKGSLKRLVFGSGQPLVTGGQLKKLKVYLPNLDEQEKIAVFLMVVYERIEALRKKVEFLEKYKKGAMQAIFSQKIRFKDENGKDYLDWHKKLLNEFAVVNPKVHVLPDSFIYIDLESVTKGALVKKQTISKIAAPSRAQRLLQKNDILFQTVRPYQRNNLFFDFGEGDYVASTGYAQIRSKIDSRFLYQYIHTDKFVYDVIDKCTGTSYPAINSNDLAKIPCTVPSSGDEQQKIADFLNSIDDKINLTKIELEQAKIFKKALTQRMFV